MGSQWQGAVAAWPSLAPGSAWLPFAEAIAKHVGFSLDTPFDKLDPAHRRAILHGTGDALMHPYDQTGRRHMEYIRQRGSYDDLPLAEIMATFAEVYGTELLDGDRPGSAEAAGDDAFAAS